MADWADEKAKELLKELARIRNNLLGGYEVVNSANEVAAQALREAEARGMAKYLRAMDDIALSVAYALEENATADRGQILTYIWHVANEALRTGTDNTR